MIKINVYFSEEQLKGLRKLSKETGLSVSEHLRRAADCYLEMKAPTQKAAR